MNYKPPALLFNAHLETIYPSLLRRVLIPDFTRERIATPDHDFLDLDWLKNGNSKLLIISHGLEGSSTRPYVKGLARAAMMNGFDVMAWNFRGCSGEINQQLRFYHSGATEDLDYVIQHILSREPYKDIFLAGFSLGGNLTLKYLGERSVSSMIKKAVVFSVPLNLYTSCLKISRPSNRIYSERFLKSLKGKVILKHELYPELDVHHIHHIKSLIEFDDRYTAPLHGFKNALDYYENCSSIHFLSTIATPTLIINALNDPFLSADCFPHDQLMQHKYVTLETPSRGGHVGFAQFNKEGLYWSEVRAMDFILR